SCPCRSDPSAMSVSPWLQVFNCWTFDLLERLLRGGEVSARTGAREGIARSLSGLCGPGGLRRETEPQFDTLRRSSWQICLPALLRVAPEPGNRPSGGPLTVAPAVL